jgi:hypothetical protein
MPTTPCLLIQHTCEYNVVYAHPKNTGSNLLRYMDKGKRGELLRYQKQ